MALNHRPGFADKKVIICVLRFIQLPAEPYDRAILFLLVGCLFIGRGQH